MKPRFHFPLKSCVGATSLAILAAMFFLSACSKNTSSTKPAEVDHYTCSMHPSVKSFDPKAKCPICGMDLIPVLKKDPKNSIATNSTADPPTEFIVPVERQQQIGVTFGTVEKRGLTNTLRVVGSVAYDQQRHWDYVARVDGYVEKLFVFAPGELVEKNAPLLSIYSPDLLTTQKEFLNTLQSRDQARSTGNEAVRESMDRMVESTRQRLRLWNIGETQIAELEQTRKPQEMLTLYSPFKGVVQNLAVDQGRHVSLGDHLVDVVDLSVVWVWAQFYQDEWAGLKPGQEVSITTSSYPDHKFKGKISLVDPFFGEGTRTGRARIQVENADLRLRPEMYVDVSLTTETGSGLVLPASAVLPTGKHNVVFVDKLDGKLEPRFVQLGGKHGDYYEVRSGLKEGERVVTSANFLIDAEAKVQGALKSW